jgi:hypothetical protein
LETANEAVGQTIDAIYASWYCILQLFGLDEVGLARSALQFTIPPNIVSGQHHVVSLETLTRNQVLTLQSHLLAHLLTFDVCFEQKPAPGHKAVISLWASTPKLYQHLFLYQQRHEFYY